MCFIFSNKQQNNQVEIAASKLGNKIGILIELSANQ